MVHKTLRLKSSPVQFGTDGWRGILGVDFTLERLLEVAVAASQELYFRAPDGCENRTVIIGFDRRFLAPEFAEAIAAAVRGCDLEPLLSETSVTTPACSWAVVKHQALGALVITASHNPPHWMGLKIKGPYGSSVEGAFTKSVEKRLLAGGKTIPIEGSTKRFDCRSEHLLGIRNKFDIPSIVNGLKDIGLKVIVDPMHGSAAGCIGDLFGEESHDVLQEIRSSRDPFFGGNPPEPLAPYLKDLIQEIKSSSETGTTQIGLVFDGDGDRLAAVDEKGRFCSTQLLMPLLIDHLARVKNLPGCVIKTVSGSDLMSLVAQKNSREILELPVGFKYIAAEMFSKEVLVGGEESGGIGFGGHIPERDALYAALLVLEALAAGRQPLGKRLDALKAEFGESVYERIDLSLDNLNLQKKLEKSLEENPPNDIQGQQVTEVVNIDGIKLRLGSFHWVMFRFSGTEPLLRIYCEAPTQEKVNSTLKWASNFAETI